MEYTEEGKDDDDKLVWEWDGREGYGRKLQKENTRKIRLNVNWASFSVDDGTRERRIENEDRARASSDTQGACDHCKYRSFNLCTSRARHGQLSRPSGGTLSRPCLAAFSLASSISHPTRL